MRRSQIGPRGIPNQGIDHVWQHRNPHVIRLVQRHRSEPRPPVAPANRNCGPKWPRRPRVRRRVRASRMRRSRSMGQRQNCRAGIRCQAGRDAATRPVIVRDGHRGRGAAGVAGNIDAPEPIKVRLFGFQGFELRRSSRSDPYNTRSVVLWFPRRGTVVDAMSSAHSSPISI